MKTVAVCVAVLGAFFDRVRLSGLKKLTAGASAKHFPSKLCLACAAFLLTACGGLRGGWESVPYTGDTPPSLPEYRMPFEADQRSTLILPGLTLRVRLLNQIRTYDSHIYFYVLPLWFDTNTVKTMPSEPGKTDVWLHVSGSSGGFVFRPQLAKLIVAGKAVPALAGFETGSWDQDGNRVKRGGKREKRAVPGELALSDGSWSYFLILKFPMPTPSPEEQDIALDLSEALRAPDKPTIPLIRFNPTRWQEGYT